MAKRYPKIVGPNNADLVAADSHDRLVELELRIRSGSPSAPGFLADNPVACGLFLVPLIGDLPVEVMVVIHLTYRYHAISWHEAARGDMNVVHVSPRSVYRVADRRGAAAIIVAHNHPSGDPTPSAEDRELTSRLRQAGDILGISLVDHMVVAGGKLWSLAQGLVIR